MSYNIKLAAHHEDMQSKKPWTCFAEYLELRSDCNKHTKVQEPNSSDSVNSAVIVHKRSAIKCDTQLYVALSPINYSNELITLQSCLSSLHVWFCENGMALNPSKLDAILFGTA